MRFNMPKISHTALAAGTAVMLLGGYADLVRGGITLGPVLLVIAYGVLIPLAIWRGVPPARPLVDRGRGTGYRPSYRAAAITAGGVFALYLVTLAPSTALWDASEYIAAAYTVGLPHPPGNPFFVLLGRFFAVLPLPGGVAVRINVLAALSSAVSAGLWFLVAERATVGWLTEGWQRRLTAAIAALLGATAFTVWNQSVVNEKVYTVSLLGLAVVSWLALRWCDEADPVRADRLLLLIAYLCGLGYANHMAGILPLPAVALAVMLHRPRTLLRVRILLAGAGLLVLGGSLFATQPIRAAYAPAINEGEPTACRDGLRFSCTFSRGTWDAFVYNFNREQYGKPSLSERQAPFTAQVGMWWLYFKWQWLRDVSGEHLRTQAELAGVMLALGLLGAWVHYRASRRSFWYFGTFLFTITLVLIWYLNFRYGASQAPSLGDAVAREVRDRDYFYLWSFSAWGVWAAMGLVRAWEALASLAASQRLTSRLRGRRSLALTAPVLGLALVPLVANWQAASRRDDRTAIAFARDLLNSVEPYSLLVTYGDNDTFPLWYAQEVEGVRRDVTVAVLSLLNTDWFPRSIIRRPVHEYDVDRGPAIYKDRVWRKPDGPPVELTIAQADSLPGVVVLREPVRFEKAGLKATIEPEALLPDGRGGGLLQRSDIFVLRAIADTWPERPIYFSRTTADYAYRLGLGEHLVSQGLARKLVPTVPRSSGEALLVPGGGWFDLDRSVALWNEVFQGPDAIVDLGHWVDRPSITVPYAYLFAGAELSEALRLQHRAEESAEVLERVNALARAVGLEPIVR